MDRLTHIDGLGRICRLGLATRGNTSLDREDVLWAVDRGIHYLNWCGYAQLAARDEQVREHAGQFP